MNKQKLSSIVLLLSIFAFSDRVIAQSGGASFNFLDMGQSARVAALGGGSLSVRDNDITLSLANPSLINSGIDNNISFNYVTYPAGINYGFVSYSKTFKKAGSFAAHLQYGNYGKIRETDEFAMEYGEVSSNDLALIIGWGRDLDSCFSIGANFKMIYSNIHTYNAFGMAVDVAATYSNRSRLFSLSLLLRNMGGALVSYSGDGYNRMPFEVSIALSQKIPKTPLRIFFEAIELQKWDLNYDNPNPTIDPITREVEEMSKVGDFFDNLARHLVLGLEIVPYKGFYLRASYNYMRSRDMLIAEKPGLVGFAWGVGLRIYKFDISYSHSHYSIATFSPNYITFTMDINKFKRKR